MDDRTTTDGNGEDDGSVRRKNVHGWIYFCCIIGAVSHEFLFEQYQLSDAEQLLVFMALFFSGWIVAAIVCKLVDRYLR